MSAARFAEQNSSGSNHVLVPSIFLLSDQSMFSQSKKQGRMNGEREHANDKLDKEDKKDIKTVGHLGLKAAKMRG